MASELTQLSDLGEEVFGLLKRRFSAVYGERSSDDATIEQSYAKIRALGNVWNTIQSHVGSYITRERTHHNRKTLPYRLPNETLTAIFRIAALNTTIEKRNNGTSWYYHELLNLMKVSTSWWSLIMRTPSLWSVYDVSYPPGLRRQIIDRSSQHPLDVWINTLWQAFQGLQPEVNTTFIASVFDCRHRVRGIDIRVRREYVPSLVPLLSSPLPQLKTLNLFIHSFEWTTRIVDLSNKPRLRELRLQGLQVDWSQIGLPRLETLYLQEVRNASGHPVNLQHLLETLRSLPGLKSLSLMDMEFIDDLPIPVIPSFVLLLKEMDIRLKKASVMRNLLLSIADLPQCGFLRIAISCSNFKSTKSVGEALPHISSMIKGTIGACGHGNDPETELALHDVRDLEWVHKFSIAHSTPQGSTRRGIPFFLLETVHPHDNLEDVLSIVKLTRWLHGDGSTLVTLPGSVDWNQPETRTFFEDLSVSSLHVETGVWSRRPCRVRSLLAYLGGERSSNGRTVYPLPHLERLSLLDMECITLSNVLEMLRSRQRLPKDDVGGGLDCPQLFSLSLAGRHPDPLAIREIRGILGDRFRGFKKLDPRPEAWPKTECV